MNSFHYHYSGEDYQRLQHSNAYLKDFEATLDASSNILELAETLQTNTSIETVRANIHESFAGSRLPSEILVFFEALGSRPALHRIFLGTFRYPQTAQLSVQPLSLTLLQASRLTFLEVCGLELAGTSSDFTTLGASLHNHPSLKEIKIYNCRLAQEQHQEALLDPLVTALASIRSLQRVVLNASVRQALGRLSPKALRVLCSGSLQAIGLLGFRFGGAHMEAPARALTVHSCSLKEICLGQVQLGEKGDAALAQALQWNDCALEYLDLQLGVQGSSSSSEPIQIANALNHTNIKSTTRLKHLFLHGKLSHKCQRAFAQAAASSTLESLELMDGSPYMPAIRFHLKMNGVLARTNLRSSSQWPEVLMAHRNDISAIF